MKKNKILVVEDEQSMQKVLSFVFEEEGYCVKTASTGKEALSILEIHSFDLIIQDIKLPDIDGIDLLGKIKEKYSKTMVVIITAISHYQMAVQAMRLGAFDFLKKPFDNKNIKTIVKNALEQRRLIENLSQPQNFPKIIGNSEKIHEIQEIIKRVAPTDSTVLIYGESGTGKELVARSLHLHSIRQNHVFIPINCAALADGLLESELFGYVKGAFTNATRDKTGLFEVANNGTFFLDEIGEMSQETQVKLLRVLENREFIPVGSTVPRQVDVRFVSATHRDLMDLVKRGEFREDLFYRLNVISIEVPSLRQRKEDMPLLAGHFLAIYAAKMHKYVTHIAPEVMSIFQSYEWPGNIRELCNVIQRAVLWCDDNVIKKKDIKLSFTEKTSSDFGVFPEEGIDLEEKVAAYEKHFIREALKKTKGNLTKAAELLRLKFRSLRYKVKKYDIDSNEFTI